MGDSLPILPGTVSFLALSAIARGGPLHGFEVLQWIKDSSGGDFLLEEGALYPALHRLEKKGWLRSEWATSEKGRRAKYYSITAEGRRGLENETVTWDRYVRAVHRVVRGEGAGA